MGSKLDGGGGEKSKKIRRLLSKRFLSATVIIIEIIVTLEGLVFFSSSRQSQHVDILRYSYQGTNTIKLIGPFRPLQIITDNTLKSHMSV